MEVRRLDYSEVYFPFSELNDGNQFVLKAVSSPVFEKTGRNTYCRLEDGEVFTLDDLTRHSTKVKLQQ